MRKIIDCHTHIFSNRVRASCESYFHDRSFAMLYGGEKAGCAGVDDLISMMGEQGVAQSWTLSFPWKNDQDCERENLFLLEAAAAHPGKLVPFASLADDGSGDVKGKIRACARDGFAGIGEIAFYESGFGDREEKFLSSVLEGCAEEGMVVVIHINEPVGHTYTGKYFTDFSSLCGIMGNFPGVTCVLSHWGGRIAVL